MEVGYIHAATFLAVSTVCASFFKCTVGNRDSDHVAGRRTLTSSAHPRALGPPEGNGDEAVKEENSEKNEEKKSEKSTTSSNSTMNSKGTVARATKSKTGYKIFFPYFKDQQKTSERGMDVRAD
ncbi:hypothetical protein OSTOST_04832 [Ostertagia ostertagi]